MADLKVDVERANTNTTTTPTPTPSIPQLFAHLTRRDVLVLFTPACIVSILAGGISPFMTRIIGQAFNAFASYPLTRPPPPGATHTLLHDVGIASVELVALAGGILALSSLVSALWMWVGERNVMRLRKAVYDAVASKDMAWFDIHLSQSSDEEKENAEEEEGGGSGGLLSKFISSTEDVRTATSLAFGTLIQDIITFLACLVLAFMRSWDLTLIILASIPVTILIQGLSQSFSHPLYTSERALTNTASTKIDRAISSITTIKAFNSSSLESTLISSLLAKATLSYRKCSAIWGLATGTTQFTLFAMFVQGFWYGSKLVRDGKKTPGDVTAVFWACVIASSALQVRLRVSYYSNLD
jgi:ATP-binding cassette subfamily B (MDR/TAP) protein 1